MFPLLPESVLLESEHHPVAFFQLSNTNLNLTRHQALAQMNQLYAYQSA
jgi:hypothetical protein